MKPIERGVIVLLTSLGASLACPAHAQDWPQWRGENRDAKALGFNAPKIWPKELSQKWKVTVGSGDASPALVGDKLYVFSRQGDEEVVRCLEASSGNAIWEDKYAAEAVSGPDSGHGGPRSSPAVTDGKVFTLGAVGTVSCLDAGGGKLIWRKHDFPGAWPRFHTAMSPLVVNGLCIVQLGKEKEGAVVAYDVNSGDQKWQWTGEGPGYASPISITLGETKVILSETSKSIVALAATDGKLLWEAPYAPQGMAYNAATPIAQGQTVIFCGQGRGARAVKFEKQGDTLATQEVWSNSENSVQFNTPVLKDGLLFGLSQRGYFFCLNAETGKTAWTDPTGGRGGFGSIVDAGSVLVALNSKAQLTVFEPSAKAFTEVASLKASDKPIYAYPVLAGNRLFIKDQDAVMLFVIE